MTESEWLACADPISMLISLRDRGKGSDRKFRLFCVECCRGIGHLLTDDRSKAAIEITEKYADRLVPPEDLIPIRKGAEDVELETDTPWARAARLAEPWIRSPAPAAARLVAEATIQAALREASEALPRPEAIDELCSCICTVQETQYQRLSRLLHDIFGNPFHPAPIEASWLKWHDATVPKIAQAIYDDRAFDRLPVLADALEEAGCTNAEILNHCRSEAPHVRGCWVVDWLLGKQ